MSIHEGKWAPGTPCWVDLAAPDRDAASAFYAKVLGWEVADTGEEFGGYLIATRKGQPAAGIGQSDGSFPSVWTVYVASDDVDAAASAVTDHGGSLFLEPGDVGPLGRMCIAADPAGAVFGVWQAGQHNGIGIANEPGALTWEDVRSTDAQAAKDFYAAVFGLQVTPMDGGPDDSYATFNLPGGEALGGIGGMMGAPEGTPSHWLAYFGVAETAAAVAAAEQGGGAVVAPPFDTPYGPMAVLADPGGAVFAVVQMPDSP